MPTDAPRVLIGGVSFSRLSEANVVDTVFHALDGGEGGRILTVNVDILAQCARRPELATLVRGAEIVVTDGMPLVWASTLLRDPVPGRVTGADLVWSLAGRAALEHRSLFLLGGRPGAAVEAGEAFTAAYAGMRVIGAQPLDWTHARTDEGMQELIAQLVVAQPDLVFLAVGFPPQELLAAALAEHLPRTWFLGCGSALDLAAGQLTRPNTLIQRSGAEWLYRLVKEPRRLAHRYLIRDAPFAARMLIGSLVAGLRRR